MATEVIIVALIALAVMLVGVALYYYLQNASLEDIRADVYDLFLQAEHTFTETEAGQQKMKWVIQQARGLLPLWAQCIISEELLESVIEEWFDMVKDLLDDGKFNKSVVEGE